MTSDKSARPASYDGFISYSHAADGLLAPRLQSGLQRFAKPWWKRRAVRVFRDESSLSANPHLWSSITEALDSSEWFVLLLSPEAAESEWVGREIEHWVANRDPSRIVPVVTSGEFGWVEGDVSGSSVPSALRGVFSGEPRWVDLRFAEAETQLDLSNPAFAAAVADIAATLRGVPKDELASEEVRQHRRTIRTAWAAGVALLVVSLAAISFAIRADQEATSAQANALAGFSGAVLAEDSELALLLAIQSVETQENQAAVKALQDALQRHRHRRLVGPHEALPFDINIPPRAAMSPDGRWAASVYDGSAVEIWAIDGSDASVTTISLLDPDRRFGPDMWFGKDSQSVLVNTLDSGSLVEYRIYSVPEGDLLHAVEPPQLDCYVAGPPSQGSMPYMDLSQPVLVVSINPGPDGECPEFGPGTVWSFDLFSGETEPLAPGHVDGPGKPTVDNDWTRLATAQFGENGAVIDLTTGEVLLELPTGHSSLSPDGTVVIQGIDPVQAVSVDTGEPIGTFDIGVSAFSFGSGGDVVYTPTPGSVVIFDARSGTVLYEVESTGISSPSLSDDGTTLFTMGADYLMRVSDVSSHVIGHNEAGPIKPERGWFIERGMFASAGLVLARARPVDGDRAAYLYDIATGDTLLSLNGIAAALSPDARVIARQDRPGVEALDDEQSGGHPGEYFAYGVLELIDVRTREVIQDLEGLCTWYNSLAHEVSGPECTDFPFSWRDWVDDAMFSPDGSLLAIGGRSDYIAVWNTTTGEIVWSLDTLDQTSHWPKGGHPSVAFSPDSSRLVVTQGTFSQGPERMLVLDTATWQIVAEPELPDLILDLEFAPDGSFLVATTAVAQSLFLYDTTSWEMSDLGSQGEWILSASVSPDSSRVATASPDGQLWIWDVETRSVIQRLSLTTPSALYSVAFLDNDTILVGTEGEIVTLYLDADRLMDVATSRLTRSFTSEECASYNISPCPTLEDLEGN